jgi:hypothetical protein
MADRAGELTNGAEHNVTSIDTQAAQDVSMIAMPSLLLSSHPIASVWRLTEAALVMETAQATRWLGRWDRRFGCWEWRDGRLAAVVPDKPVLDRRGVWLEPGGERDDGWYASRAALAAYFSLIPTPVRRLVAPHGDRQWSLLEEIWRKPEVARTLDDAQRLDQRSISRRNSASASIAMSASGKGGCA